MRTHTVFTDQHTAKNPTPRSKEETPKEKIQLTKDEYKEIVKEAYKEGVADALSKSPEENQKNDSQRIDVHNPHAEPNLSNVIRERSRSDGLKEAIKSEAKIQEQTRHKLANIANRHDIEILRIKGTFPFDLFPDTLIIDTTKVTIVKSQMFATENIITIPLKDLADVHIQTAVFLASITISYMPQASSPGMLKPEEEQVACLKRSDAIRAKNIMKGIMVAQAEDIDIAKLSPEAVFELVEKVGHSEGIT